MPDLDYLVDNLSIPISADIEIFLHSILISTKPLWDRISNSSSMHMAKNEAVIDYMVTQKQSELAEKQST